MKKIIPFIIFLLSVSFISCERIRSVDESTPAQVVNDEQVEENENDSANNDSANIAKIAETKVAEKTKSDIDSLFNRIEEQQTEINGLQNKVNNMLDADTVYMVVGIASLVLLIIIIFFHSRMSSRHEKLRVRTKTTVPDHIHADVRTDIKNLQKKVSDLYTEVNYAPLRYNLGSTEKEEPQNPKEEPKVEHKEEHKEEQKTEVRQSSPREFYMPRTITEKSFDNSKAKVSKDESTFFKFTLDRKNPKKAEFVFDPYDTRSITTSFDDRDRSIATVCEIEVESNSPISYVNNGKGKAELKNGVWEVTSKLKLKYV